MNGSDMKGTDVNGAGIEGSGLKSSGRKGSGPNGRSGGGAAPDSPFASLRQALFELHESLQREARALAQGDAVALERLAGEKQGLLDAVEWALPRDGAALPDDLLETLHACRTGNRENAEAVATRLSATRDTLRRIGRLVGLERSIVYRSDGELEDLCAGRRLGSY